MNIPNRLHGISRGGAVERSSTSLERFDQLFCHSVAIDIPNLLGSFKSVYAAGAVKVANDSLWQRFRGGRFHAWSVLRDIR